MPAPSGTDLTTGVGACPLAGPPEVCAIICPAICACDRLPILTARGRELRQSCVTSRLRLLDAGGTSSVKVNTRYDMGPPSPPRPLSPGSSPKGQVRIPDAVILKNPAALPTQDNLAAVVEIKFPGDRWGIGQQADYEKIAGDNASLEFLTPEKCGCGKREEPEPAPSPLPVEAPAPGTLEAIFLTLLLIGAVLDDSTGVGAADDAAIPPLLWRLKKAF